MKRIIIISIGLVFSQCSDSKKSEVGNSILDKKKIESNRTKTNKTKTLFDKINGRDAIKLLQETKQFQFEASKYNQYFELKIDKFSSKSDEFHYLRTI